ncbi:potassium/sodium hyperpolarization-activated cyclic nucleotide-gated channel 2-like [Oenanthe melanoleuca]|uniref:potassium/sodium hyperpolarization-activated cyclic nucleotide-gated channel 2-like n=1 Tax=Oenanthe melanoleuca TaxID=2939378 RepID=UPI0024C109F6|nr:potassium/sodium hyperpolarization-activated cyclic nucleotide-gated channel 2-like [Oenanthe melanoleuca]
MEPVRPAMPAPPPAPSPPRPAHGPRCPAGPAEPLAGCAASPGSLEEGCGVPGCPSGRTRVETQVLRKKEETKKRNRRTCKQDCLRWILDEQQDPVFTAAGNF